MSPAIQAAILLTIANVFMTFAWYGHLKFKHVDLWKVVLLSWGIAFVEYCFQVPANRIGHKTMPAVQLKIMQEIITIGVFCVFSVTYLNEPIRWNHLVAFGLVISAVFFVFADWSTGSKTI